MANDEEEEWLVLELEEEVESLAEKVDHYRTTLPHNLTSIIASQLPTHQFPQPEKGLDGSGETETTMTLAITGEAEELEKMQILKEKIASNASAKLETQRMKEYMAKIHKLETSNVVIHPAFKKKRTN